MDKILYKKKNRFGEIEVIRKKDVLFLLLDGFANNSFNPRTKEYGGYPEFMHILRT